MVNPRDAHAPAATARPEERNALLFTSELKPQRTGFVQRLTSRARLHQGAIEKQQNNLALPLETGHSRKAHMNHFVLASLVLVVISCSPATRKPATDDLRPVWLKARPVSDQYYTGIGHSIKDGNTQYLQAAKNSALEDLISEIKVAVEGTSTLNVVEDAGRDFSEKYQQIVKTRTAEELEEYETAGTWEDAGNYWVYYRLSKSRYREIKEARKRAAATLAQDFLVKAREARQQGQMAVSINFYFKGIRALEKHFAEPIRVTLNGQEIILNTAILTELQLLLDNLELVATPAAADVNRRMAKNNLPLQVTAVEKTNRKPVPDLPLTARFTKGSGELTEKYQTGASGKVTLALTRFTSAETDQVITIRLDGTTAGGENPSDLLKLITSQLVVPSATILFRVQRPLIHLSAKETMLGNAGGAGRLAGALRQYLTTQGIEFTEIREKADLLINLESAVEKGNVSGSIFISYLNATLRVLSADGGAEIYSTSLDRVKGYNLDYPRSAQDACTKAIEELEKDKLPALLKAILQ